jgi:SAM-dependent methyltransferase
MTAGLPHRRFQTAASYYLSGRPSYAEALIRKVAMVTGLRAHHRVLDIGTGPGQLAVAFAPYAREIVAIDPEPEMLKEARANAGASENVTFCETSSDELGPQFGHFRLATMGRAFHWTDRADCLRRLDMLIERGGAIALFKHSHPAVPENNWTSAYDAVLASYRDGDDISHRHARGLIHEAFLLNSAFSSLERIGIIERRHTPLQDFISRALSLSTVWQKSDPREGQIETSLRTALHPFVGSDGAIVEIVESKALIAKRP